MHENILICILYDEDLLALNVEELNLVIVYSINGGA